MAAFSFINILIFIHFHEISSNLILEVSNYREKTFFTEAAIVVAKKFYAEKFPTVPTVNIIYSENYPEWNDIGGSFLKNLSENLTAAIRLETISYIKLIKNRRRFANILLITNLVDFFELFKKVTHENFRASGCILLLMLEMKIEDSDKIFLLFWRRKFFNVNLMFRKKSEAILVETFLPYNLRKCDDSTPVIINEFKDRMFVNGTEDFFPEKTKNLQNCPLKIAISEVAEPFIKTKLLPNGSYSAHGVDIDLISTLSESLNFKLNFSHIAPTGYLNENGSSSGSFKALLDNEADLTISGWFLKANRIKFLDASNSYMQVKIVFMVPPGQQFTSFEKLIFPFSLESWILIGFILIFGCFCIFLILKSTQNVRSFVFGTNVVTPYLNLLIAFLGGVQTILPRRNFARFLLIMFLIYSLIVRTLYQGSFYKISHSNKYHKEPQTIDEMIKNNFKFFAYSGIADLFEGSKALEKRLI